MSSPDTLSGYILEHGAVGAGARNDEVLACLPEIDHGKGEPPLCRSMFSVVRPDQPFAAYRGQRAIGLALHRNHLFDDLALWLPKFEALLRRLHWMEVRLTVHADSMGIYELSYEPDDAALDAMRTAGQLMAQTWEFRLTPLAKGPPSRLTGDLARPGYTSRKRFDSIPDRVRLQRALDAARTARDFVCGKSRADLDTNELLFRGLTHILLEMLDQIHRVSDEGLARIPEIPWKFLPRVAPRIDFEIWMDETRMTAMRRDEVWHAAEAMLPFIPTLEAALAPWPMPTPPTPRVQ